MATRSRIGIQLKDNSVLSAYHHWDGYPEWLGKTLVKHFNSKEKASELIDGGDMSVCWTTERWNSDRNEYGGTTKREVEEYGPQYYSQRGEDTLLFFTNPLKSSLLKVKNLGIFTPVLVGSATICTSLRMISLQNLWRSLPRQSYKWHRGR